MVCAYKKPGTLRGISAQRSPGSANNPEKVYVPGPQAEGAYRIGALHPQVLFSSYSASHKST